MTDIAEILRAAEIKHAQLGLELQFQKNLELFRQRVPRLYRQFKDYEPEELRLSFSESGYVDLVNYKINNRPVYPCPPIEFCRQQLRAYLARPAISRIGILDSKQPQVERFFQARILNELGAEFRDAIATPKEVASCPIGFMIMSGIGLGYHIPELLKASDIYSLCIYDPHPDSFYASMHTIDWGPILEYFSRPHRRLKFFIGVSERDALHDIRGLAGHIGIFNLSITWLYRHFQSNEEQRFLDLYCKEFHFNAAGMGFLEDEQVSLAHTTLNLNAKVPVLMLKQGDKGTMPPVIIVGNGPSLDGCLDKLREMAGKAIIFSCGSTSGTLCKAGIIPDFHVEMERTRTTFPWLMKGTTEQFREKVTLLALNTVAPDTFDLFPRSLMAMKTNDPGFTLLDEEQSDNLYQLNFCNPTVTNCGLAFADALGFKEVYLMGVDLGWKPEGGHHSTLSLYNEFEGDHKTQMDKPYQENSYQVKGNFIDSVITNITLDDSRSIMELLLKNSDMNVYNLSDGSYIDGTSPLPPSDFNIEGAIEDKKQAIDTIIEKSFKIIDWENLNKESFKEKHLKPFFESKKKLMLDRKLKRKNEIFIHMNNLYKSIEQLTGSGSTTKLLLRGSMNAFFMCICRACLFEADNQTSALNYQRASRYYNEFLNQGYGLMESNPLQKDQTLEAWEINPSLNNKTQAGN